MLSTDYISWYKLEFSAKSKQVFDVAKMFKGIYIYKLEVYDSRGFGYVIKPITKFRKKDIENAQLTVEMEIEALTYSLLWSTST
jgi:hypothetical protein